MRLSSFKRIRNLNNVLGVCLCLVLVALVTAGAGAIAYTQLSYAGVCRAAPLQQGDISYANCAAATAEPVIQIWKVDPMVLNTATSFAVYTFKVKNATQVQMSEAGVGIGSVDNPTGATLQGTANGNLASSITTDQNGQFISTIIASNGGVSVQAELTLSLAKELLPEGPPPGSTGTQKENKSHWLNQNEEHSNAPLSSTTTDYSGPDFFKCPDNCKLCMEPGDAASHGFTNRCSDQPCFYNPEKTRYWYCYSEPVGWCCANQQVSQTTKSQCTQVNGYWSLNQYEAQQACQPKGYCCYNGQIYAGVTKEECALRGGSYWSMNQSEVMAYCQPPCWCCAKLQVFQTTQAQCLQSGGTCYSTQSEAASHCRVYDKPVLR